MADARGASGSDNGTTARTPRAASDAGRQTLARTPAGGFEPMRGTMLWFNQVKDLGVVTTEDGEALRIYGPGFAAGERPTGRCAGAAVTFAVTETDDERTATDVSFVPEVAPRRARLRHGRFRSGG